MNPHLEPLELDRFLDGELSAARRAQVEAHLSGCNQCHAQLEALALAGELLRQEVDQQAAAVDFGDFNDRVLERARATPRPAGLERLGLRLAGLLRPRPLAWAAAAAVVLLVAALLLPGLFERQPAPSPAPGPATPTLAAKPAGNRAIIDSMEYAGQRSLIYTVSRNNTTVIWLYDFDQAAAAQPQGDEL